MKLYNTLSGKKEEFKPIEAGKVRMYACGPTVYNFFHIGNARAFLTFDLLRRYLEYRGYDVTFVQNFTDIDDKMINKANAGGITVEALAAQFIGEYEIDARGLGIGVPTFQPRATEHISEIIEMTKGLVDKNHAYVVSGDVYFRARSFEKYGQLTGQNIDDLQSGARIAAGEVKEDPLDFALWKAAKDGEPFWESPFGNGRPGWHIECSAMAGKYLGAPIDIHGGGKDLVFPHHQNEVAQSECFHSAPFANYWLHNGYINVDNQKMSKSLNNFFTVRDVAREHGYLAIRYFLLGAHYRSPINYTSTSITEAKAALSRIKNCYETLRFALNAAPSGETADFSGYNAAFIKAMDDDLNTADALGVIFELVRDCNSRIAKGDSKETLQAAYDLLTELGTLLGILETESPKKAGPLAEKITVLLEARRTARANKDFGASDALREEINALGCRLDDSKDGQKATFEEDGQTVVLWLAV